MESNKKQNIITAEMVSKEAQRLNSILNANPSMEGFEKIRMMGYYYALHELALDLKEGTLTNVSHTIDNL